MNDKSTNILIHLRAMNLPKVMTTQETPDVFARVSWIDAEGTVRGTDETEVRDTSAKNDGFVRPTTIFAPPRFRLFASTYSPGPP
jgi:hypothetical protein